MPEIFYLTKRERKRNDKHLLLNDTHFSTVKVNLYQSLILMVADNEIYYYFGHPGDRCMLKWQSSSMLKVKRKAT